MEINKEKTIAFTGNRILTSSDGKESTTLKMEICEKLYSLLESEYLENGYNTFLCGMALGFDTISALVSVQLKRKYKDIRFIAVIPFIGQDSKFSAEDKNIYSHLLGFADFSIVTNGNQYSNESYHERNDFLLANASKLIAYHNGKSRSGTASTIRKAMIKGIKVENIYTVILYISSIYCQTSN